MYKQKTGNGRRDWRTYEQQVINRLETAFDELQPLVYEAVNSISFTRTETRGVNSKLTLEQKVIILLLKHIFGKSNRTMSAMFIVFSWLTNVRVGYKTVERLHSDELVQIALNNLHKLILDKKGLEEANVCGDGTGYSLTIRKHYASHAQTLKDKAKEQTSKKRQITKKQFLYSFALMDIDTRMYIAYGASFKSEKEAYKDATKMLNESEIKVKSIRLDKYFSNQSDVEALTQENPGIKCYLIPKVDATIKGKQAWKDMLKEFISKTQEFLEQYYKRNQSESGFAEDKKRTGWCLGQKRFDRIHVANCLNYIWHNLCWLAD
ncbi:MAG: ISNCY family transposase [Candidatus Nanoarchaeia archaeon]